MKMDSTHFKAGEAVIRQGDTGDIFYMIREGHCQVVRKTRRNPEGVVLAELGPGDHFGEDALISDSRRNASVIMLTDGVMMTLAKADFLELLNEPLLQRIDYSEAQSLENAVWIDVRLPSEHQSRHIRRSINIPLQLLRDKAHKLDRERRYIIYCDTGLRSSTAAYLLMQRGLDASVLSGGIKQISSDELIG
jgi:CRP-like cAMP-binding protein